ncbi:MAG: transglutaminase [Alteromonadaceae bacterium]|uniref:transglutaminase-like cysteine peptidase n=1 Tax=Paraglaciecola chathamensis TaxID=368405 RepID=UPI000C5B5CD8|nr:transglutaminase-like cysteine peptidase [Paraglaciecola agarilytica]MBN24183.1 transglutaminase [Alteromonadaceae bacterium]|tara:strand:+ start:20701 stop:21348 length:648 start_codon:yes stop_codon:yes gene_type:complete
MRFIWYFITAVSIVFMLRALADSNIVFNDALFNKIRNQYDDDALERVRDWQQLLNTSHTLPIDEKLYQVNNFFNELEFVDDIDHWGKDDYWATPVEFLATEGGDCEDFVIAKYFSLKELGVPAEKLRLMYVTATRLRQAHMVLAYYEEPNSVPLVLDNINRRILPASRRRDLLPVYSFNGDGLWLAKEQGRGQKVQQGGNNNLWNDLNKRMQMGD